ncbi:MAG: DUF456 domain-containing protein [Muribaculaceae bacterium]|nr:DUF456 domain-containing protein [Muribaculaceae bacterium]
MDILLYIVSIVVIVVGLVGCVLPVIPGPILAFGGYLLLLLTPAADAMSWYGIVIAGLVTLLTIVSDFVVPVLGVKMFNGTDNGKWGSFIGGIAGLFFMPIGIIAGPFLGALLGELIGGREFEIALKSAVGSLIGFLCGTLIKIIGVIYIGFLAVWAIAETIL